MSDRKFEPVTEMEGGRRVARFRFTCGRCGVVTALNAHDPNITHRGGGGAPVTFEGVDWKLRERKWSLGATPDKDRCPNCTAKDAVEARRAAKKPELTIVKSAPVEMQREDRRIILAKLNEVYLDEQRGYDNGWSDHRVAEDLGVPRKWVEGLREENFGPAGDNEGLRKFAADVKALVADLAALSARADELTKLGNALADDAKRTRDALRPLERQVAAIAKMTGAAA